MRDVPKLSGYDEMLQNEYPAHLKLKQMVRRLRPKLDALEQAGARIDSSPDDAILQITKGDVGVRIEARAGKNERGEDMRSFVTNIPFTFYRLTQDPQDPATFIPVKSENPNVDEKYVEKMITLLFPQTVDTIPDGKMSVSAALAHQTIEKFSNVRSALDQDPKDQDARQQISDLAENAAACLSILVGKSAAEVPDKGATIDALVEVINYWEDFRMRN